MRTLIALAVVALFLAVAPVGEAANWYVRSDGNDQYCTGATDATWNTDPNHTSCAKKTIEGSGGYGGGDDVASSGDTIKVHSNTVEGVLYDETPVITTSNLTIEGYGGSGRPRIGKVETLTGWSGPTNGAYTKTYNTDYNDIIWGAYVDLKNIGAPKVYEHERMTLIVHKNLADLTASATAFDANCPTTGADPTNLYLGPGFHYDPNSNVFSVRLAATPEFTEYNSDYLNLSLSTDPNNSKILVSSSEYSLRVDGASGVTLKNLQLEAARGALTLDNADNLTVDNLVIWSGFGAAVRGDGPPSNGVTIKNSYILHDTPYWVAWSDCKESPAPCSDQIGGSGGMRDPLIEPDPNTENWTIEYNVIRGGHDGFASKDGDANFIIRYNVFADFADDPIELEDLGVGRFDIYGNFITNSLNCLAVGQENDEEPEERSTVIEGPVYYYSNICALARVPFVDRWRKVDGSGGSCCYGTCKATWNGSRRYGHEAAFKLGDETAEYAGSDPNIPIAINTHVYQNTIYLADSHPDTGMDVLGSDPNVMRDAQVFNNMFLKLNGRVGQSDYLGNVGSKLVDFNLYWKMNSENDDLLAGEDWVGDPNGALCDTYGFECNGVGGDPNNLYVGSNPVFHHAKLYAGFYEGLDCFGQECDGIDDSTESRWMIKPGSEFIEPELFIPTGGSPACGAGRGGLPEGFPDEHVINSAGTLDPNDIGAVGCDITATTNAWVSAWNSFPFNQMWATSTMASASVPVATITEPEEDPYEIICPGLHMDFCAEKTDTDGAAPYAYSWVFSALSGGPCPSTKTDMCPQDVTFSYPAECLVTLTVTDRWGKWDTDTMTVNVGEVCAPRP